MRQIARIQDTRIPAVVQDNSVLFVVSILDMKKSFKAYSPSPGLSDTISKKCCLCTMMATARGWVQSEMATQYSSGKSYTIHRQWMLLNPAVYNWLLALHWLVTCFVILSCRLLDGSLCVPN